MLYILFTPPDRVKFSEYIPHLLVRASSQKKAREFAAKAYPKHPVPLLGSDGLILTRCAPVLTLSRLCSAPDKGVDLYFAADSSLPEDKIRECLSSAKWPDGQTALLIQSVDESRISAVSPKGKAGVISRTENVTPMLKQVDPESPVFAWKCVSEHWPNPTKEPNLVQSDFMKPEIIKTQSVKSFVEQERELIERLMQP